MVGESRNPAKPERQSCLSQAAIKAARRLQALPAGRTYQITLVKRAGEWLLSLQNPQGAKIETLS
jgi:hypothetical protein